MRYYPELPSRFVIIPRHTQGDSAGMMFVDTDPCHVSSKCSFLRLISTVPVHLPLVNDFIF